MDSAGTDWTSWLLGAASALLVAALTEFGKHIYKEFRSRYIVHCGPYYIQDERNSFAWNIKIAKPRYTKGVLTLYIAPSGENGIVKVHPFYVPKGNLVVTTVDDTGVACLVIQRWVFENSMEFHLTFSDADKPLVQSEKEFVSVQYNYDFRDAVGWHERYLAGVHVRLMALLIMFAAAIALIIVNLIYLGIHHG